MSLCLTCNGDRVVPAPHVGLRYTMPDQPCPDCGGTGELDQPSKPEPKAKPSTSE